MNYILVSLKPSDGFTNKIMKRCRHQKCFNKNIVAVTSALMCYIIVLHAKQQEQAEQIKKLEVEIKELRSAERE